MKLPPTYRSVTGGALLTAGLLAWSVLVAPLRADDETSSPAPQSATSDADQPAVEAPAPAESLPGPEAPATEPRQIDTGNTAPADVAPDLAAPRDAAETVRLRELVSIMNSSHLRSGEVTPEMVTIMGNAVVDGVVEGDCVTVMGNVTVNGKVRGELVCVGGVITLGPGAEVRGEIVSVGGGMKVDPGARIRGDKVTVHIPGFSGFGGWMAEWFQDGLGKARVLPHNHTWAWGAAAMIVLINLLFAAMFGGAVTASARAIETRPVFAFINGALVMLLAPVLFVLLAASVIGIPLVPVAVAGLFLCWFLGTIGIYAFCGQQFGLTGRPVMAALVGNLVFLLLYALPIVGFAVWSVTGLMGLGAAVTALGTRRREAREARLAARKATPAPMVTAPMQPPVMEPQVQVWPTQPATMAPPAPVAAPQAATSAGFVGAAAPFTAMGAAPAAGTAAVPPYSGWNPPPAPPPTPPPAMPAGISIPPLPVDVASERATFWPRLFAFLLDLIAVTIAINVLGLGSFPVWVLAMFAYHILFWGWRGTTPAGIVMNLQVVRDDGTPMDYRIAAVRALSGVFSIIPAGMGFIWVAFDRENQSWHDKLAGTSVVSVRKARPLI